MNEEKFMVPSKNSTENISKSSFKSIFLALVYLIIGFISLNIINNNYTIIFLLVLGIIFYLLPFRINSKLRKTIYPGLISIFFLLLTYTSGILNPDIEVSISQITKFENPTIGDINNLLCKPNYQLYLYSNYMIRDLYFIEGPENKNGKIPLGSTITPFNCSDCVYYILTTRNKEKELVNGFKIIGELPTNSYDILQCDFHSSENKGIFGRGRIELELPTIYPNETLFCVIKTEKSVSELNVKCQQKGRGIPCQELKFNVKYINAPLNETYANGKQFPNIDGKELKCYILNENNLEYEPINCQTYVEYAN